MSRQTCGYYSSRFITFPVVCCTRSCGLGNHANRVRSVFFLLWRLQFKCYENAGNVVASTKSTLNKCKKSSLNSRFQSTLPDDFLPFFSDPKPTESLCLLPRRQVPTRPSGLPICAPGLPGSPSCLMSCP